MEYMNSTNQQIVESIIDSFKTIEKDLQMYAAIEIIVAIANEAGVSYCESNGIIDSAKADLRELLIKDRKSHSQSYSELTN